ncbi:hypothetical protein [Ectobacillus ponti]|uniref:Uncharacterized protein n=1 Tax=Ectobacillus ponti TaxID=2961894 RepID=A0AA41XA81_9BACI|nr:hypothetical protein [Ectobacillus ponti]MCP8969589.1 hypothetical protein [Ectobacillus ponti]
MERKPFREWGIGLGAFLAGSVLAFLLATIYPYLGYLPGLGVFVWGIYMAAKRRPYILIGIVSAPFILGFISLIICGSFLLINS